MTAELQSSIEFAVICPRGFSTVVDLGRIEFRRNDFALFAWLFTSVVLLSVNTGANLPAVCT